MPIPGDPMDEFEACAAAGRGERLMVFADKSFGVELVVVGIKPKLTDLFRRATPSIRVIWCRNRPVRVPAAGEIHHPDDLSRLEAGIMHGEKTAACLACKQHPPRPHAG